jgi:hypothetical protein
MSDFTSSMLRAWSGVSVYGKLSSSSRCHVVSPLKANPGADSRAA